MAPLCGCRSTKIGLAMNFYKTIFRLYKIALKSVNNGRNYVWSKLLHFLEHSVYHWLCGIINWVDARYWYSNSICPSVRTSVCLSVCPLRSGILWKQLNILSWFLHHTVAQSF